jgi:hypothetical protein
MTEPLSDPYLILHLVRGEPEFGVAMSMERNGETWWVICSSGHRAFPFRKWHIGDLADVSDINYAGRHDRPIDFLDTIPEGWPDHYGAQTAPKRSDLDALGLAP